MSTDKAMVTDAPKHQDWIEHLCPTIYIRFTCGPDYERAFLCVEDGEPDMRDVATMSFGQARLLMAAYSAAHPPAKREAGETAPPESPERVSNTPGAALEASDE